MEVVSVILGELQVYEGQTIPGCPIHHHFELKGWRNPRSSCGSDHLALLAWGHLDPETEVKAMGKNERELHYLQMIVDFLRIMRTRTLSRSS